MVLAVPAPPVRAAGITLTSGIYGTDVTDGITFLANPPVADLFQNSIQSIPNATNTAISFDSTTQDTYTGHSNVTNNSRYTAVVAGTYWVHGLAVFSTNGTGFRAAAIARNGVANTVTGTFNTAAANSGYYSTVAASGFVTLAVGDYIELQTYQTSGGSLNTGVGGGQCSSLKVWWAHA